MRDAVDASALSSENVARIRATARAVDWKSAEDMAEGVETCTLRRFNESEFAEFSVVTFPP